MVKFNEGIPIYMQIIEKIKADIVSGKLKGGDKLPSVREVSESFKVNPNTIQRVFQELEREGFTYAQRGIGTFIVESSDLLQELKNSQAHKYTARYIQEMGELGIADEELLAHLKKSLEEKGNENTGSGENPQKVFKERSID